MSYTHINKNIFYLIFVQLANYIAPLVILPYLSRTIGLEGVGTVVIALSLCSLALIFTDFGFAVAGPYWIAKNNNKNNKLALYMGSVFILKLIFFIIILLTYITCSYFINFIKNQTIYFHIIILSTIFFQSFQITWFFQGIEKMKNITICTVTTKITYLILVIVFVSNKDDVNFTLFCFMFSNLLSTTLGLYLMYKEKHYILISTPKYILKVFKGNTSFFLSRAAVGIYTSASTFLVGNYAGTQQAALYSSAEKLYQGAISLTAPVSQALYPHLAKSGDRKILYKFIFILSPIMLFCGFICIYFSDSIITFIYGKDFLEASSLLKIFILISIISFISINFGYPAYSTIGRLDLVNKSVILGGTLQLILIITLTSIDKLNANSIVISILFTEIIILLFRVLNYLNIIRKEC
ncbi:oligosaccharide flippase family protein [Proteus terrae]|uniref:oligosaccharide flippase family protein n=1 Tax=Proteus terrae TaxID=1574161 RepID=UPI0028896ED5|nr:oligosaccharide flippase family protein [Proteus terrae]